MKRHNTLDLRSLAIIILVALSLLAPVLVFKANAATPHVIRISLKHFVMSEFDCKETGENAMNLKFLAKLDKLRARTGFKFIITSGYRSKNHSVEAAKITPGTHTRGIAADIRVTSDRHRMVIVAEAVRLGFTGIGISKNFIHVDMRKTAPVMWVYK